MIVLQLLLKLTVPHCSRCIATACCSLAWLDATRDNAQPTFFQSRESGLVIMIAGAGPAAGATSTARSSGIAHPEPTLAAAHRVLNAALTQTPGWTPLLTQKGLARAPVPSLLRPMATAALTSMRLMQEVPLTCRAPHQVTQLCFVSPHVG